MTKRLPRSVSNGTMKLDEYHARAALLGKLVWTVRETMDYTGLARTSIQAAIDTGKIIARKADADEGERGGVWLIEAKSVRQAYPNRIKGENE